MSSSNSHQLLLLLSICATTYKTPQIKQRKGENTLKYIIDTKHDKGNIFTQSSNT